MGQQFVTNTGIFASTFPKMLVQPNDPTVDNFRNVVIGDLWLSKATGNFYGLSSLVGSVATWTLLSPGSGTLTSIIADSGTATPTAGAITISGGTTGLTTSASASTVDLTGVLISDNGGTGFSTYALGDMIYASAIDTLSKLAATTNGYVLTLSAGVPVWAPNSGGVITWENESGSFSPSVGTGYFITNTATATLPASPTIGDTISFIVDTSNVLTIQAVGAQTITIGSISSSAAGTISNTLIGDSVTLIYSDFTDSWKSADSTGTWSFT